MEMKQENSLLRSYYHGKQQFERQRALLGRSFKKLSMGQAVCNRMLHGIAQRSWKAFWNEMEARIESLFEGAHWFNAANKTTEQSGVAYIQFFENSKKM